MPLVHVIPADRFLAIILAPPQELLPSDEVSGRTMATTIQAEDILGLGRCLYFYAGRACPDFGDVALAFAAGCEAGQTGAATPFDTGGLAAGHIRTNLADNAPATLRQFADASSAVLTQWRDAFGSFLAAYFDPGSEYWSGRPSRSDPEGIFQNPSNSWRAWVFEVRFREGQSIHKRVAWAHTEPVLELVTEALANEPPPGAFPTPLQQFLDGPSSLIPQGGVDFCDVIEEWAQNRAGL